MFWIKNNYEIARTNRQFFVVDVRFTGNDYNEKFYGDWTVETYIDDEALSSIAFLIQ